MRQLFSFENSNQQRAHNHLAGLMETPPSGVRWSLQRVHCLSGCGIWRASVKLGRLYPSHVTVVRFRPYQSTGEVAPSLPTRVLRKIC